MLEDLLEELRLRNYEYSITNGWFEITLGNTHYQFSIFDENEVWEMKEIICGW